MRKYYLLHRKEIIDNARKYRIINGEKVDAKKKEFLKTPEGKLLRYKIMLKHNSTYPERRRARQAINNGIRDGKVSIKPCEICGDIESQAHHPDYSKPLKVRWLCHLHHQQEHGKLLWKK